MLLILAGSVRYILRGHRKTARLLIGNVLLFLTVAFNMCIEDKSENTNEQLRKGKEKLPYNLETQI